MALLWVTSLHFYNSVMIQQVIYDTLLKKSAAQVWSRSCVPPTNSFPLSIYMFAAAWATSYPPHEESRDLWETLENFLFVAFPLHFQHISSAGVCLLKASVYVQRVLDAVYMCVSVCTLWLLLYMCTCICVLVDIWALACVCILWRFLALPCLSFSVWLFLSHYKTYTVTGYTCYHNFL